MTDVIIGAFLVIGSLLMFLASLGLVRMPDLLTRMHASSKAGPLGGGLILAAAALYFGEPAVTARVFAIIVFIVMTTPVAAHIIGRAGYFVGIPLWENTLKDELRERYNRKRHTLASVEHPRDDDE